MGERLKVLVVDDEPDILETLEFSLAMRGLDVATAADGLEALEKAKRTPPDVMILDVMLPGCNGYEVSRLLKEWMDTDPQATPFPILLLTARRVVCSGSSGGSSFGDFGQPSIPSAAGAPRARADGDPTARGASLGNHTGYIPGSPMGAPH